MNTDSLFVSAGKWMDQTVSAIERWALVTTVLVFAVEPIMVMAQPGSPAPPPVSQQLEPLTDQQRSTVKSILSRYIPTSLTAEDARSVNEAFRAAGLRNGPALRNAVKDAGFDPEAIGRLAPPPSRPNGDMSSEPQQPAGAGNPNKGGTVRQGNGMGYSLEQAVSDRAQLTTIAFDGLAFMTGDLGCNTFLPPGKVSDFFGFQYMRDIDAGELGHNTSFLPRIANATLAILNNSQKQQLVSLAMEQETMINDLAYKRFPLIKAFCRLRDGDLPGGASGLDREAVKNYAAEIYAVSGQLAYRRAQVLGAVVRSLDAAQRAALGKLVFGDSRTWPEMSDQVDKRGLSHSAHVAVMTYASELFSWYAGSVEADVYFCPEGHGTYFGSFYMKDMPAMGNPNYSISTSITGNSGEEFLAALSDQQRTLILSLVELQRADLNEIVGTRRSIAVQLRRFMTAESTDRDQVAALARRYGELDGDISYLYATAFSSVYKTLTGQQKTALKELRNPGTGECKGAFLYSQPISMPAIPNTDVLFGAH
jgi:hypothetical protein